MTLTFRLRDLECVKLTSGRFFTAGQVLLCCNCGSDIGWTKVKVNVWLDWVRTVLIIPFYLQTNIIAQMLSVGGDGENVWRLSITRATFSWPCVAQWKNVGYSPANFPVLRLTCSWRVTTYVDKPSAVGQPTRPTQPFILSGSINWVAADIWCVLPCLGGAIWWMLTRWLAGFNWLDR